MKTYCPVRPRIGDQDAIGSVARNHVPRDRRFREGNPHFAVVAFDGQPPLGFITLDNLLGALVGEQRAAVGAGDIG